MSHVHIECQHGYSLTNCLTNSPYTVKLIACRDVPECPAYGPAEFTDDDLNMIMAMCKTANPQYPERDMYPAWHGLYLRAQGMLLDRTSKAQKN